MGAWRPISVEEAVALGEDPGVLELSPMTGLIDAPAGETRIEIAEPHEMGLPEGTDWFRPGDRIIINPGGLNEERAVVAALGSLVLTEPLTEEHHPGEMIIRDTAVSVGPDDGEAGPTTPTTPTTQAPGRTSTPDPAAAPGAPPGGSPVEPSEEVAVGSSGGSNDGSPAGDGRTNGPASSLALTGRSALEWLAVGFVLLGLGGTLVRRRRTGSA